MTKTIAKALRNIVLPDGNTVHEGEEFIYNHDFVNAGEFEIVGEQNENNDPTPDGEGKDAALSVEEMKNIRLKAKDLKIANWHTKGIERLLKEIEEAEATITRTATGNDLTPVESETANEGNANA